jgi:hypothetical protein
VRRRLPETLECRTPGCRAWSWELAAGKPCPYCRKADWRVRVWTWMDRIIVVVSLAAMAALLHLSGVI